MRTMSAVSKFGNKPKPFLRWAGSKKQLLPILETYWGNHQRYLEPFCGSAALFFHVEPKKAFLNDTNKEVVNAFRCVQQSPQKVYSVYSEWECDAETYKRIRAEDKSVDEIYRAARFIYLMRQCYGGVFRVNTQGHFNVPYGNHSTGKMPSKQDLVQASSSLSKVTITNLDYSDFLETYARKGDFIYLDPPYSDSSLDYSVASSGKENLLCTLQALDDIGAVFVLSCSHEYYSAEAKKREWRVTEVEVRRSIASKAAHRKRAKEFIISNEERKS